MGLIGFVDFYLWEYDYGHNLNPKAPIKIPGQSYQPPLIEMVMDIRNKPAPLKNFLVNLFELAPFLDKNIKQLSGGTKQKVNLVLGLMFDSPIVILDEPSVGLDPISLSKLKNWLKQQKQLLIICSHMINFVEEISDQAIFMVDGKIVFESNACQLEQKILKVYAQNH